jgi:hypothetical protein
VEYVELLILSLLRMQPSMRQNKIELRLCLLPARETNQANEGRSAAPVNDPDSVAGGDNSVSVDEGTKLHVNGMIKDATDLTKRSDAYHQTLIDELKGL